MRKLEQQLLANGFLVVNEDYPSDEATIEVLAVSTISHGIEYCNQYQTTKIHFVTHSMGGILVRSYFQQRKLDNLGRIVMIAPPNQGSEVVDKIGGWWLFQVLTGPAGQQLGTGSDGIATKLEPIKGEIGIIAGDHTLDPWLSWMIPGVDDGKVSVMSTILPEMTDFKVVYSSHPFIMRNPEVIEQVITFLNSGSFEHEQQ